MTAVMWVRDARGTALWMLVAIGAAVAASAESGDRGRDDARAQARQIIEATGIRGGLVVHLGCGDGRLTAALYAGESWLVQGLDAQAANVATARQYVRSLGLYGNVSIDRLDGGRLPYVDNLINLLVAEDLRAVTADEVLRVLAPAGVAYLKQGGRWTKTVKPRPADIDEWTHFLHDASNNAVAKDTVVGPPRQLQWVGGPRWTRSHDHLAGLSALVSAGGRLFEIVDEGPVAAVALQPQWSLVARDAFNGVVLWSRPIAPWQWHLRGFRSGPSDLARRLVAIGDRVYVTLSIDGSLSALDAATGATVATYEGTEGTQEVICDSSTLFVVAGTLGPEQAAEAAQRRAPRPGFAPVQSQRPQYLEVPPVKRLLAIDARSGRQLWARSDAETAELMPTALAAGGGRVFFQNPDQIICLDARSGREVWRAERRLSRCRPTSSAPTLVAYGDVLLSADCGLGEPEQKNLSGTFSKVEPEKLAGAISPTARGAASAPAARKVLWYVTSAEGNLPPGELIALSAGDGKRLWSCPCRESFNSATDVFVADGLVWTGDLARNNTPGITEGRDPKTGEVRRTRPDDHTFFDPGAGHGRCYRNKATERYLVLGRSGVEFVDLTTGTLVPHQWARGVCQYGVMPCNGLLYVPQHSCACFINAKLSDFNCLAPRPASPPAVEPSADDRLERGPAFVAGAAADPPVATGGREPLAARPSSPGPTADWPTYRHDAARSGVANSPLPAELRQAWQAEVGGKLSSLVMADGRLLVAQVDAHTVHALSAESGRPLWTYTAGGRIDSPPSVWQGRVLFGAADGYVYCLRAADGALVWRLLAAPCDERIVAHGQVESAWPVPGSVLVYDGLAYCVAGRSSYLDGGIGLLRIDVETGRVVSRTEIDDRDPATGVQRNESMGPGADVQGALPDVLSCDGQSIYLRHNRFDLEGRRQAADVVHLFSSAGFLDDSWWHRTYWQVGVRMDNGFGGWRSAGNREPAGRILAVDGPSIYGFGRDQYVTFGSHVGLDGSTVYHFTPEKDSPMTHYRAFAVDAPGLLGSQRPLGKGGRPAAPRGKYELRWTQPLPVLGRAMVLTPGRLLLAGPPDFTTAADPAAALEGKLGGLLCVLGTADGHPLAQYELKSPPVFDGMIAAAGRVYLATCDGRVVAFGGN